MRSRQALIALVSLGLAGCAGDRVTAPAALRTPARSLDAARVSAPTATAGARWVALTREIVGRREPGPLGTVRAFALVSVAQYDAVVAAERAPSHGSRPSEAGAASAAAAAVLSALYPAEQAVVDAQVAADDAALPTLASERHADYAAGLAVGQRVAAAVLARAAADRSDAVWTGTIPEGPGLWRNAPPPAEPLGPLWGRVRPWVLSAGDQFRPAPPPAFGSPAFEAALAEVRRLSDTRTPEQLRVAQYWQSGSGPGGPMGHFGEVATRLAVARAFDERRTTRTFAVLYMAMMDASIACWDAKYAYWYVRPFQADPLITTPVGRPNFPSYPSAHSCLSAAAAGVLAGVFPSAADGLHAEVAEAGEARLYAGLHFRFDVDAGQQLGGAVARVALTRAPRGHARIPLR